jgi:hypothetical protein
MPAFVVRFYGCADASGNQNTGGEDTYSLSYDHFHELYSITTTFSNGNQKPISMNTLDEVKQFFHTLYKYVNLDMPLKSGNYIAFAQIDAGVMPSISFSRRELQRSSVVKTLDDALDVWAKITVPGIHLYTTIQQAASAPAPAPVQPSVFCHPASAKTEIRNPWACCEPGGWMYEQNRRLFN